MDRRGGHRCHAVCSRPAARARARAPQPGSTAPGASAGAGGTTVEVTLQEWAVVPAETSAPAGTITFAVTNEGPDDVHEFVIIQTDLEPGDLPTDDTGAVDESGEGIRSSTRSRTSRWARPRRSPSTSQPGATS